jgi:hypothetical protein
MLIENLPLQPAQRNAQGPRYAEALLSFADP